MIFAKFIHQNMSRHFVNIHKYKKSNELSGLQTISSIAKKVYKSVQFQTSVTHKYF